MLHWDGKMLPEIRGGRSLDRTAVLVIRYGQEKLPNVSYFRGGEAGSTCVDIVQEHHLPERMKGLSSGTSASNTWIHEPALGKRRLPRSNFVT